MTVRLINAVPALLDIGSTLKDLFTVGIVGLIVIAAIIIAMLQLCGINILSFKARKVGDGQHGNARWMTEKEKRQAYPPIAYTPALWRSGQNLPPKDFSGVIIAAKKKTRADELFNQFLASAKESARFQKMKEKAKAAAAKNRLCGELLSIVQPHIKREPVPDLTAYVQRDDKHTGVYASSGAGKTAYFLYPNLEYACACGMSFLTTDTKGDLYRNYGYIAEQYYGYRCVVLDLRNPTKSNGNNILAPVNKYMDLYLATGDISAKAKSEKYANLIAENIIAADGNGNYGANTYFYDSAKGLLTATILLVSEFGAEGERHIPSVFTLLTELLEITRTQVPGQTQPVTALRYSKLIKLLPIEHRARLYAIASVTGSDNTTLSVLTTALSKLNNFIDSELEQLLCFENDVDIEKFCAEKTALFVVLPEEDTTKYFIVSLLLQQFYRECLIYADMQGGRLPRRIMFYLDEIGTIPKITGFDMMLSAARSRDIILVPIMQAPSQMADKYGQEQAKTINTNLACVLYGGFAPESDLAKHVSETLGNMTVLTGSVSSSSQHMLDLSTTQQMTGKPLISPNELNQLPKGTFLVRSSGNPPLKSTLMLFTEWGITFTGQYEPKDKGVRTVKYLSANDLERRIRVKYASQLKPEAAEPAAARRRAAGQSQTGSAGNLFRPAQLPPEDAITEAGSGTQPEPSVKKRGSIQTLH